MNAKLRFNLSINTTYRLNEERFRPSLTSTEAFNVETELDNYTATAATLAVNAFEAVELRRSEFGIPSLHLDIWLENITHPTPAAGVVPLPKGNITGCLNNEELESSQTISDLISKYVLNLKTTAGY